MRAQITALAWEGGHSGALSGDAVLELNEEAEEWSGLRLTSWVARLEERAGHFYRSHYGQ